MSVLAFSVRGITADDTHSIRTLHQDNAIIAGVAPQAPGKGRLRLVRSLCKLRKIIQYVIETAGERRCWGHYSDREAGGLPPRS
jgi:hypothetical protein